MTLSMKDSLIEERGDWYGAPTVDNLEAIARRLKRMLEGRRYTFVSANDYFGPLPRPEVRTSQHLAPESSRDGQAIYTRYGEDKSWGFIGVNDSYGVWYISTSSDPDRPITVSFQCDKLVIDHYPASGNHLIWVIALEDREAQS